MSRFALVDCNNFFVSCERVFNPKLDNRPVVILSNNDGCIIARSNEAKAFGIAMAAPWFKVKDIIKRHGIISLSSNYALYGDMSARVMSSLAELAPKIEIYSVDECFLDTSLLPKAMLAEWGKDLRNRVIQWTGIPVSIGLAETKTLAKLANQLAKKNPHLQGVLDLSQNPAWVDAALQRSEVGEIWGIGRRWSKRLNAIGIHSALDLREAEPSRVRHHIGVSGIRTQKELRGEAVFTFENMPEPRKTCCCTRSFGKPVTEFGQIRDAITRFSARAAEKIRKENLVAGCVQVFIQTSHFRTTSPQYGNAATIPLSPATSTTSTVLQATLKGLNGIWKEGFDYAKAGVILMDLTAPNDARKDLFTQQEPTEHKSLMVAIDKLNTRYGNESVHFGLAEANGNWHMKQDHRSPAYTTNWQDIPTVR